MEGKFKSNPTITYYATVVCKVVRTAFM